LHSDFLTVGSRQYHYHTAGSGPPVVLLHPSPLSSRVVLPIAAALARHYRVYAIDTPGYGLSDAPETRPASLDDYLDGFAAAFDALGLGRICLYGAATGAQFAIAFARRFPQRVALLVLDSAGHIGAGECNAILRDYFPDVRPQADGRHLATTWQMVHDLFVFFPWCDTRPQARLARDLPPPAVMQEFLLDYLRAGTRYDWAYRPAFEHERIDNARAVTVAALLVRWEGSSVLGITDALIAAGLPPNYAVLQLGPTPAERYDGITAGVLRHYRDAGPAPELPNRKAPPARFGSRYALRAGSRLHVRLALQGSGRPLLWLHGAGSSAAQLERLAQAADVHRPCIVPDLPGHGESSQPPDDAQVSVAGHATTIDALLDELGIDEFDVVAQPLGQCIARELRSGRAARRSELRPIGLAPRASLPLADWLDRMAPSIAPQVDGTHLPRAWHMVRDAALWSPWWQRTATTATGGAIMPTPEELHARVVDLMKAGDGYRAAVRAEYLYRSTHPEQP
jgi:pimeloyl-ACP methyl ester carboxylesterase